MGISVILFIHIRAIQAEIRTQINHAHATVHQPARIGGGHAMRQGKKRHFRPGGGNGFHIGIRKPQIGTRHLPETGKHLPSAAVRHIGGT